MASILLVGLDPAHVDFSDPNLPPGVTAGSIRAGISQALRELKAGGHDAESLFIPDDPDRLQGLATRLAAVPADCVVIGGGVRVPPRNLRLFEAVLNVVARAQPTPAIALVDHPDQSAPAVARVLAN